MGSFPSIALLETFLSFILKMEYKQPTIEEVDEVIRKCRSGEIQAEVVDAEN